ncbi:MAG: CoA transferase [Syntrophobacteraceae bacterium]|jgi:crotonobetainyl-CoA:carnitine CoA-transferase CaiB-like acyl-CoA transferase
MDTLKPGPLSGINVLDFTWVLAGPHATKTLADMGANVIKVDRYKDGANERLQPLRVEKDGVVQSSYHLHVNRGKKSICVNLKHPMGLKIIHELLKVSDIVIENFAPGVMERLKLDYESVRKIKPDIIYCSISAFGHWGPNSNKPGYDVIAQAASGWTGRSDPPIMAPMSIGDTTASMHACTAMLAALFHHMRTGQGQNIDIALVDCLFTLHEHAFPWYWTGEAVGKPVTMPPTGQKSPTTAPYGIYNGKNGQIAIASMTPSRWPRLVDLMGPKCRWMKEDPRFAEYSNRCTLANAPSVHEAIDEWVMSQDSVEEAERKLEEIDIPCSRVKSLVELATVDPQIGEREMRPTVHQPFLGPVRMYGSPLKFSETPSAIRGYAPFVGEHNKEVLSSMLNYTHETIEKLYQDNVIYHAPEVERLPEELKNSG